MDTNIYETIAANAKKMFLPSRQKRGRDTTQLSNFIDDLTALHQKYHEAGQTPFDSSHVLLELSISTMMKTGHRDDLVDFGRFVRNAGDCAVRMLEQHTSLVPEVPED